ncbi:MAG: metal ABC transporter ATP-binding protein [Peptostreptococcaceae bacterium]|nr:metal ABC transporter ATP-binding protein [Peptostreptococcaceae bacterium]
MMEQFVVEIEDLTVAYQEKPVLWDIDLNIPKGRLMAIVGPNGAGKTTLLKAMLGLLKPVSGEVRYPLYGGNDKEIKKQIGYVPQSSSVDWDFPATVQDVVLMGCYGKLGWLRRPRKEDRELAKKMLEKVGMQNFAQRQISQLSGGQQQRVFLARALAQEADIYFMDEPFKGVDAQTERTIVDLLKELKSEGKTVVVVHHDLQTVKEYFDHLALINLRVIASGTTQDVFTDENLKKAYRSTSSLLKSEVYNE